MPLSSKRFVISTSGLNSQGFRMLTSGAVLDGFIKNPVLLFNHIRPEGNMKNQILPIGHWQDIKVEGDEITGVPYFDDKDEFAMQIYNKVEGGHIRMCSAGAEPLETSKRSKDLLPGQKLATVTKWLLKEGSICDIGANPDSLNVALYDSNDKQIKLSESTIDTLQPTNKTMANTKTTAAEALAALKKAQAAKKAADTAIQLAKSKVEIALADDATTDEEKTQLTEGSEETEEMSDEDANSKKDAEIADLKTKLADCEKQVQELTAKLAEDEENKEDEKATKLADKLYNERKIKLTQKADIIKLAKADYDAAVSFGKTLPAAPPANRTITDSNTGKDKNADKLLKLSEKSFDELFKSNELEFVKLNAPGVYKEKFKEKFGKEPRNA